jgi:hypothetical protein
MKLFLKGRTEKPQEGTTFTNKKAKIILQSKNSSILEPFFPSQQNNDVSTKFITTLKLTDLLS